MSSTARGRRADLFAEAGPVLCLQATVCSHPWRIGPAWALLAGALASGVPLLSGDLPLRLAGALILADPVWGLLWRMTACAGQQVDPDLDWAGGLPYAQPNAPLARALRRLQGMSSAAAWHELPVALVLMAGLSLLLGPTALAASLAVLAVVFVAWITLERDGQPALPYALLGVGLPWMLGTAVAAGSARSAGLTMPSLVESIALAAAVTILQWGVQRACLIDRSHARCLWLGQGAVLLTLTVLRQPWALAVVAVMFLPPSWWIANGRDSVNGFAASLSRSSLWWLAAMIVAVLALRYT
jgi:hypothetical protein